MVKSLYLVIMLYLTSIALPLLLDGGVTAGGRG